MKFTIGTILTLILIGGMTVGCSSFGTRPNKETKSKFESSSHYNKNEGVFENRLPGVIKEMKKRTMNWKMFKDFFSKGVDRSPSKLLPEVKPDIVEFLRPSDELKTIWFGHSSFLLNMDGVIVLVDPVFGESAAPFSFMVKRFQKAVLELNELPKIDYIIISHDHYDHLDMTSIKYFADKETKFVTPLGVGSHLKGWGIDADRITERDWWQKASFEGIDFIATPAQHFSGRNGIHENETLWASWVIQTKNNNIYFSGDSGYDTHFKDIGEKYGPFDVAFLESGQYDKRWKEVHMLPEEAISAFRDLGAKKYFPVHWGMFVLALHTWYEPIDKVYELTKREGIELVAPKLGQIVYINQTFELDPWWNRLIENNEPTAKVIEENTVGI